MTTFNVNPFSRYDYIQTEDPAYDTNPSVPFGCWLNTATGEEFVCIDNTTDGNIWIGSLGNTVVGMMAFDPYVWYDFSDASTLFTDAGITPVTADADLIYQINDKGTLGNNLSQATSADRATYKTAIQNGLSVARFDGVSDHFTGGFATTASQINTIFAVANLKTHETGSAFFYDGYISGGRHVLFENAGDDFGSIFAGTVLSGTIDSTGLSVHTSEYNSTSSILRKNGVESVMGDAGTDPIKGLTLCASQNINSFAEMDWMELVFVPRQMTLQEIQLIEASLANKWGIIL